jgi:hypothetical protein
MFAVLAGLGILTVALFPLALPGLLLFVVAPLLPVAVVGLLVAIPLALPLWLARAVLRSAERKRMCGVTASSPWPLIASPHSCPWTSTASAPGPQRAPMSDN